ncbi:FecCD family ABC transporter permease [Streptomyces sp. TP-A0874]|uniref:FecCD family ABC transporter permease n=1 Tax=Streptomyces sp. TP-A0874 TaxID=549819 RepID=UPI00099FE4F9|nr:iron chelate uptake ABC transporter family permease subunit [Streptomyces sp. TP-A0874]
MTTSPPVPESDVHESPGSGVARNGAFRSVGFLLAVALLVLVALVSIAVGSKNIGLPAVWDALFSPAHGENSRIVRDLRVPRTVVGLVVGAALGVAGGLIQALTRNPLADPGILGVNAGAAFSVALAVGMFGIASVSVYIWFAFAGALLVTAAIYLIGSAGRGPADPVRLVLAGVALSAVLSGITVTMTLVDRKTFEQMRNWNAGSFVGRGLDVVVPVLPFLGVGLLLALLSARRLNAIALGDDIATALGVPVVGTRIIVLVAVTLLAGGATAIAGPVGFLGLMTPHIARWITGPDQRWILAYTAVLAPVVLLVADIAGRLVMRPGELPVGIVTAFVGAPVLIVLMRRRKVSGL